MKSLFVGAAILAVLLGISGCGQRGPLYFPKIPPDIPEKQESSPEKSPQLQPSR
jgi:predicted small lipoprotein YifL